MEDEDEEEYDEEEMIAKALAMSMPEGHEATPEDEPKQDLKDIMTSEFMKDIIKDMNLNIDENEVAEII